MKIFHYTTIEKLALILKNRTLRFSCADQVDDPQESDMSDVGEMSKFVFLSCWTTEKDENLALWHMYSKGGKGIRIEVDSADIQFNFPTGPLSNGYDIVINVQPENPNSYYIVYPNDRMRGAIEYFFRVEYSNRKRKFKKIDTPGMIEYDYTELVSLKAKHWIFQKEIRFVLLGCTARPGQTVNWNGIFHNITDRPDFSCRYVDLFLKEQFFMNLRLRLGPFSSEGDLIIAEVLRKEFLAGNKNRIEKSRIPLRKEGSAVPRTHS